MTTPNPTNRLTSFQSAALTCELDNDYVVKLRATWPATFDGIKLALKKVGLPQDLTAFRIAFNIESLRATLAPRYRVRHFRGNGANAIRALLALDLQIDQVVAEWLVKFAHHFWDPDWLLIQDWSKFDWNRLFAIRLMFGNDIFPPNLCQLMSETAKLNKGEAKAVANFWRENTDVFYPIADGDPLAFENMFAASSSYAKIMTRLFQKALESRLIIDTHPEKGN